MTERSEKVGYRASIAVECATVLSSRCRLCVTNAPAGSSRGPGKISLPGRQKTNRGRSSASPDDKAFKSRRIMGISQLQGVPTSRRVTS